MWTSKYAWCNCPDHPSWDRINRDKMEDKYVQYDHVYTVCKYFPFWSHAAMRTNLGIDPSEKTSFPIVSMWFASTWEASVSPLSSRFSGSHPCKCILLAVPGSKPLFPREGSTIFFEGLICKMPSQVFALSAPKIWQWNTGKWSSALITRLMNSDVASSPYLQIEKKGRAKAGELPLFVSATAGAVIALISAHMKRDCKPAMFFCVSWEWKYSCSLALNKKVPRR